MPDYAEINKSIRDTEAEIRAHRVALAKLVFRLRFYVAVRRVMVGIPKLFSDMAARIADGTKE